MPRVPASDHHDLVFVEKSSIHGKGLFAAKRIEKGRRIGAYEGPIVSKDGPHVLWLEEDDGTEFGVDGKNALRYLNHSDSPNAEFDGVELYALRKIKPREELTIHYGPDWIEG